MTKVHRYLKQAVNTYTFQEKALVLGNNATMMLKKIIALWQLENVVQDEQVSLTDQNGAVTQLVFGQGYWTFSDLQKQFANENVTLTPILRSNMCRISSLNFTVNLGNIGPLLGFIPNAVIQRGLTKDSKRVDINQGLLSLVISSNLWRARVLGQSIQQKQFTITIGDNLLMTAIKLHLFAE